MHAVTSYTKATYRDIVRGRLYSSLLIRRVDPWIIAALHHNSKMYNTLTTCNGRRSRVAGRVGSGLAALHSCDTIFYE